jgi:hypothetical protein
MNIILWMAGAIVHAIHFLLNKWIVDSSSKVMGKPTSPFYPPTE